MKKTKIVLIILVMLTINNIKLLSQDRINKVLPVINKQINSQLNKSIGWMLNPESQWVSRTNRIPSFIENRYKTLIDYEYDGLGVDNFITYEIRDINIEDSIYLILIKKYKDGYYKYPSIKEGWLNYTSVDFYVFDKKELSKINTITNDSINLIKINVLYSNTITWIDNETYISDIEKSISKQIDEKNNKESETFLIFHIAPYKTKNIVQFQIYSSYSKYNLISGVIKEHKIKDTNTQYSWEQKKIYYSDDLFKYCYYEVDYLTFNNFIKITK